MTAAAALGHGWGVPAALRRCSLCGHDHRWHTPCSDNSESSPRYWDEVTQRWLSEPTDSDRTGSVMVLPCMCRMGSRSDSRDRRARPAIPISVRFAVIDRDGNRCQLCRRQVYTGGRAKRWPRRALHLDHVVPYSHGGPDTVENLRVVCAACNCRRGAGREMCEAVA